MARAADALAAMPSRSSRVASWLRVLLGFALVVAIATRVDLGSATIHSWPEAIAGLLAAVVLLVLAQLCSAVRWRAVLRRPDLPLTYLLRLYLVGQFFGLFLPTSVGGDAVRALSLARVTGETSSAVASVLLDRALGLAALVFYLACGVALVGTAGIETLGIEWRPGAGALAAGGAVVASGMVAAILLWGRVWRRGDLRPRILQLVGLVRRRPREWGWLLLLSALVQGIYLATWWTLVAALRLPVAPPYLLLAVPLVSLAAMVPVTISGLGVREGAWIALLAPVGVAAADALTSSLLYFVAFATVGALGGIWFSVAGLALRGVDRAAPVTSPPPAEREPA